MPNPYSRSGPDRPKFNLNSLRIIVVALALSPIIICMVFLAQRGIDPGDSMVLSLAMAAASLPTIIAAFVVPNLIAKSQLDKWAANPEQPATNETNDESQNEQLMQIFGTRIVIAVGVLESSAVLNATAYLLEGHLFSLVIPALVVGLCLIHFPTQATYDQWREKVTT